MTVQSYLQQMEKARGIANQDIEIFHYTPIREVCKIRKQAAIRLDACIKEDEREALFQIIEDCERTIKKYLYL